MSVPTFLLQLVFCSIPGNPYIKTHREKFIGVSSSPILGSVIGMGVLWDDQAANLNKVVKSIS